MTFNGTSVHAHNPFLAMARMVHVFLLLGLSGVENRAENIIRTDKRAAGLP